jgi:hypothetical protein
MASEFDIYRQDLQALACATTLEVFRRSPVIRGIQTSQINETQELHTAIIDSMPARTLDNAVQGNLDVLGRIVGLFPRPLIDASAIVYFGPDDMLTAPDWTPVYVTGAPLAGQVQIGDPAYRTAIRAKIAKNHTKYGSAPELQYFAQLAYGATISVRNIGLSDLEIVFPVVTPPLDIAAMIGEISDDTADHQFNLPLPTTSRIARVSFRYPDAFAPDLDNGAPDVAFIGVSRVFYP